MTSVSSGDTGALHIEPIELPTPGPEAPARRRWSSLWVHVVLLGVILCALVPILDNGAIVSADEGAVLSQVEILETTGGWALPNPLPEVDPEGRWFGIDISDQDDGDFFPYAKHSAYPAAVSPLYDAGGQRLVILASALGTLAAAALASLLARRIRPGLEIPTLWVVGIVSPVFFDSFWVIAHSIGAAFATGAVIGAVRVVEDRSARWLPAVALGVAGAVLFRSEGMLLGMALAGALGVLGLWRRDVLTLLTSGLSGAVALGAWWIDSKLYSAIVGTTIAPFTIKGQSVSWVEGRWQGIWASLLRPQLLASTAAGAIFLAIALLAVVGAFYARTRPTESVLIRGAALLSGIGALAALTLRPAPVPGLLLAFPLLPIGLVLLRKETLTPLTTRIVLGTAGLFALAVIATQYPVGGSMEWGGRFFHLVLPALVPVLLVSVADAATRLDRTTRRLAAGSLAVVSAVLLVFAVGSIVRIHTITADLVDEVVAMGASTSEASDPRGPVVVSNMEAVGRLSWKDAVHGRYLKVVEPDDLPVVAERLADAGVDEFVFAAAFHAERDRKALVGYEPVPGRTVEVGQWTLTVMRRA